MRLASKRVDWSWLKRRWIFPGWLATSWSEPRRSAGHPVVARVEGEIPSLQADPTRLEQVLTNLLSNASKYSYPNTEILVSVERSGNDALVSVTNHGPGISLKSISFSRFRRTRAAAESGAPGLGLGLYYKRVGRCPWREDLGGKRGRENHDLPIHSASGARIPECRIVSPAS